MDALEINEKLGEITANEQTNEKIEAEQAEKFRTRAALIITVMAVLLALTGLGGGNAVEDMMSNNIHASDTYNFYQAKNIRQTIYKLNVAEMELELKKNADLNPEAQAALTNQINEYKAVVARYENEPDADEPDNPLKGEGKKQLLAQAQNYEKTRDRAGAQDSNFDYAETLLQLAVLLASVATLFINRQLLLIAVGAAAIGSILMVNGFFLFFPLPF